jgi:uncharacterized protein (DUF1015 family)
MAMCYAVSMPRFEPFRGLRYDAGRVDLDAVISPPYDVIGPELRERLAARHSANSVRVELPEPDQRSGLDRYEHAARLWSEWQDDGLLQSDAGPCFYAYRMTAPDGRNTNGVIGALGIDEDSTAQILPHEQTLPKPASDRLDLLRATRANLSPIWGLSMSPGLTATFLSDRPPDAEATDDDGVSHALWVLDDPATIEAVRASVGSSPVVVADGHHRYETALNYDKESAGDGQHRGADGVMALVVELSEHELAVGAINRTLSGLPDGLDLVDAFSSWFNVTRAGDFDERTLGALGSAGALALVMESGAWLLAPKDGTIEAAASDLDSSMVALVFAELPDHELRFWADWRDAVGALGSDGAQAAVLLRPVTVAQIEEWARAGRRMPPKSTYFYPKPRTGMVFRSLDSA